MTENEGKVKLLGCWASPFSRRVEMALKRKGIPYEYLEEALPNKSPLLLELNPFTRRSLRESHGSILGKIHRRADSYCRIQVSSKSREGERGRIEEAREKFAFLEKEVTGKDFFGGKTIGFVDMVAGSIIPFCLARLWEGMRIDVIPEDEFPELNRWIKNLKDIESVRECIPHREKQIEHMMKVSERYKLA
uniref:glutathione transferase n=1 Tax=Brassica campestris TaxID=3711 RepID=M4DPE4_BRACM